MSFGAALTPQQPRKKTAYTQWGAPVQIDEGMPTSTWQEGVGYAGTHYFNAPPPPTNRARAGVGTDDWNALNPTQRASLSSAQQARDQGGAGGGGGGMGGGGSVSIPSLPPPQPSAMDLQNARFAHEKTMRDEGWARADKARNDALAHFQSMLNAPGDTAASPAEDPRAAAMAYGRAKDRIGQQRLAAVQSFQDVMSGRGYMGSTVEAGGVGDILAGGLGEIADVEVAQAQDTVARGRQLADMASQRTEARRLMALRGLADAYARAGALY